MAAGATKEQRYAMQRRFYARVQKGVRKAVADGIHLSIFQERGKGPLVMDEHGNTYAFSVTFGNMSNGETVATMRVDVTKPGSVAHFTCWDGTSSDFWTALWKGTLRLDLIGGCA
jgi:hypothetical protein